MGAKKKATPRRKTSLAIDVELWKALRVGAVRQGKPAYQILDDLIRGYLKSKKGGRS